jgi:hypothetical protein
MPQFRTTYNILTKADEDELFDHNWMDSDKIILPPRKEWDYSRDLQIEDVNIWEIIYQQGGGIGLYAAWDPFAEFYMITLPHFKIVTNSIETYYGKKASNRAYKRARELGMHVNLNKLWVDPDKAWLYE